MATRRRLRIKRELEELFDDPREAGLDLKELLAEGKGDAARGLKEAAGPLKQLDGAKGLLGGGSGNVGGDLEELLREKLGGAKGGGDGLAEKLGGVKEDGLKEDGLAEKLGGLKEDGLAEKLGGLKAAAKAAPGTKPGRGAKGQLGNLALDDLGRLGVQQRADAMHGLQKRVGNQAVVDELAAEHRQKLEKASAEFERDVFPRVYLHHRQELKRELFLRLWINEPLPVVGELSDEWKRWRAQLKERAWWDCFVEKQRGQEKREVVTLREALMEIAAFQRLGIPCPAFDALLERERRRYLKGKRLSFA
jgi:hypothetical protein